MNNLIINNQQQTVKYIKMQLHQGKHLVSINLQFDTEPQECIIDKQAQSKQHKFTILVGYNNKNINRVSIKNNLNSEVTEKGTYRAISANDLGVQKYYFQRKNQRSVSRIPEVSVHTQRKCKNGITSSIQKINDKSKSKSYRIHTIDLIDQEYRKAQLTIDTKNTQHNSNSALADLTNKRQKFVQISKNKLKKKSIINQSDLCGFTAAIKSRREKQQVTINLKHRKYNKVKTELQQVQLQENTENSKKEKLYQNVNVESKQKKIIEEILSKKVDFKKNKSKFVSSQSKKHTVDMKISKKKIQTFKYGDNQNIQPTKQDKNSDQKQLQQQIDFKNKNFKSYLEFINRKKKQYTNKQKILQSCCELKQQVIISNKGIRQSISMKSRKDLSCQKQNLQRNFKQRFGTPKINEKSPKLVCQQKKQYVRLSNINQFQFSQIPEVNQSSFLSENGKKELMVNNFELENNFTQPILNNFTEQNIANKQENIQRKQSLIIKNKKNKKKQSRMSIVCRSQLKQVFPQRFFI